MWWTEANSSAKRSRQPSLTSKGVETKGENSSKREQHSKKAPEGEKKKKSQLGNCYKFNLSET